MAEGVDQKMRDYWRRLVPLTVRHRLGALLQPAVIEINLAKARLSMGSIGHGPPVLVGFFDGASGIALSVQLAGRALDQLGIEHQRVDVGDLHSTEPPESHSSSAWIFYLNPPELLHLLGRWRSAGLSGKRFGYWAWELPKAPRLWFRTAEVMNGVMAPSAYAAASMAVTGMPVTATPHPLFAGDFSAIPSKGGRLRGHSFRVVSMFDFKSSAARKNPDGAMRAFAEAFGDDPTTRLIIKTHNADFAPDAARRLREQAGSNVEFIDAVWSRDRVMAFIASADVYISLHRAEGFGLTMAEAMMLGTPVVATGWSGNLAFMDDGTACLVPFHPVPVKDPQGIYHRQTWAEPDVTAAALHLRRLRDDPVFAHALADRARTTVAQRLSPEAWFETLPPDLRTALNGSRRGAEGA